MAQSTTVTGVSKPGRLDITATGNPYWWDAAPPVDAEDVAIPNVADVVVIGAGWTGLRAALTLVVATCWFLKRTRQVLAAARGTQATLARRFGRP